MIRNTVACLMALGAAACAADGAADARQTAEAGQPDCFHVRNINGFTDVDRDTVRVQVGVNDYYDLETAGACTDLEWSQVLAVSAEPSGRMCVGSGFADLYTEESRCMIRNVAHAAPMPEADAGGS